MKKVAKIAVLLTVVAGAYWFSFRFPMSNEYLTFMYFSLILILALQKDR